jgi:hypothetical protein
VRSLRVRIERADGVDLIAKEIDSNRQFGSGREEVQDAAAAGNLARLQHKRSRFVPMAGDPPQKVLLGKAVADSQKSD